MAISVHNLLKERKFPFVFSLFLLLLLFTSFLILTNTNTTTTTTTQPPPIYHLDRSSSPPVITQNTPTSPPLIETDKSNTDGSVNVERDSNDSGRPQPITQNSPRTPPPPPLGERSNGDVVTDRDLNGSGGSEVLVDEWKLCPGPLAVDYIPCLDNWKVIKALKSRRHMEHRERHCPKANPRCLVPLPKGYKVPVPWPKSRDMIWFDNVPHPKLVEYKKEQNWVKKSGDYFIFPGGGTQFKEGVAHYIQYIEKNLPKIGWGKRTRVILDVGCGVASFGGHLLDKDVITMSFAPKDEHEAQIQFALERGIPATLSVIGTQRLTFPDNVFDLIHCARCRVHWDADGGKPLMELNRILRPGGVFIWSATPVYRDDERDQKVWNAMVALTKAICWKVVAKSFDSSGIGLVIYEKPVSSSCYESRKVNMPPLCDENNRTRTSWYVPLDGCLPKIPTTNTSSSYGWPTPWPQRLKTKPSSLSTELDAEVIFNEDTRHWSELVANVYLGGLGINWSSIRNVMDMNAGYGGFAAALIDLPLWVMNVIPANGPDTLPVIFDRGLIGIYHDWCESLSTYPRTYDLMHSSFLFSNLKQRCDIIEVAAEVDRILRPGGVLLVQDTMEMLNKLGPILQSLHYSTTVHQEQFLIGKKDFWRPNPDGKTKM